jgi:uncharacterized membrane protein
MDAGDRCLAGAAAEWGPDATMVEAVGDAYSRYGRLAAVSGVPTLLGWANHEMVWRGPEVLDETARRSGVVEAILASEDPDEVRRLVGREGVDLVALGSLEHDDFAEASLAAVRAAGSRVVECGENRSLVVFEAPCEPEGEAP